MFREQFPILLSAKLQSGYITTVARANERRLFFEIFQKNVSVLVGKVQYKFVVKHKEIEMNNENAVNPLFEKRKTTTLGHMSEVLNNPDMMEKIASSELLAETHRVLLQKVRFMVMSCGKCCLHNKVSRTVHIQFVKLVGNLRAGTPSLNVPVYPNK